jgi:hypothetical protein
MRIQPGRSRSSFRSSDPSSAHDHRSRRQARGPNDERTWQTITEDLLMTSQHLVLASPITEHERPVRDPEFFVRA